jgi:REP element-mobilizing transposase RayT
MVDLYRNKYRIRPARLTNWDYGSNGHYFITICTKQRNPYFGQLKETEFVPNELGKHTMQCWWAIPEYYPFVHLDEFVMMPDHLHGILVFGKKKGSGWKKNQFGPQYRNLANVVRGFKMAVTSFAISNNIEFKWQSRYYDRVIRTDYELEQIRKYIRDNPANWVRHPSS